MKAFARAASEPVMDGIYKRQYEPAQEGMELRDYFAAKALDWTLQVKMPIVSPTPDDRARVAAFAYQIADAMMEARKQR